MRMISEMKMSRWVVIGLASAGAMLLGCEVSEDGEEGNFSFNYADSGFVGTSDLAEGAMVKVHVVDADDGDPVTITEAYTEDEDTLSVIEIGEDYFVLDARASGDTRVTAESHGDELSDTFTVRSAEAGSLEFESRCDSNTFLSDAGARFRYRMKDSQDGELTGYGYYPVTVEADSIDESLLDVDLEDLTSDQVGSVDGDLTRLGYLDIFTGAYPGTYVIKSDIDDEQLAFDLVEPGDIDEITNATGEDSSITSQVTAGDDPELALLFSVEHDLENICGPLGAAVEITSSDPDVCEGSYSLGLESLGSVDLHGVEVEGYQPGECEITVEIPEADVSLEMSVDVQ